MHWLASGAGGSAGHLRLISHAGVFAVFTRAGGPQGGSIMQDVAQIDTRFKLYAATATYELKYGSSATRSALKSDVLLRNDANLDTKKLESAVSSSRFKSISKCDLVALIWSQMLPYFVRF